MQRILLHIFLPLLSGVLLYFFFGSDTYLLAEIFTYFNEYEILAAFRDFLRSHYSPSNFFIYQLPDALWAYAFCASLLLIWQEGSAAVVAVSAFCFCSFYEFMQYKKWTAGTFDWWDIIVMGVACCSAYFLLRSRL